jgi:hypothetical protein
MRDDADSDHSSSASYVWTGLVTVALAVPLLLSSGIGTERTGRLGSTTGGLAKSDLDPKEIDRARTLVAELEEAAEERFLELSMTRVTSRRATVPELLSGGDFDAERARGEDYVQASRAWLKELADLPARATSALTLAGIPREVRLQIVAELESLVPARIRAGRARLALGQRYVEFIDFVEGHRESVHFDEARGLLVFERTKCSEEFTELTKTLNQLEAEVKERCPPLDGDHYLDRQTAHISP